MNRSLSFLVSAVASILLAACGGNASEAPRDAPQIADLDYAPHEVNVGARTTVSGTFAFEDVNADVEAVAIEVRAPGMKAPVQVGRAPASADHVASGGLALSVSFVAPEAGEYEFAVYAVDAKGHESNRLTGVVHAR